jgi:protein TonB
MERFMLAYAPRTERRRLHPATLAVILGAHAVTIVAVMSARMEVYQRDDGPTIVESYPVKPPPKPDKPPPDTPNPASDLPFSSTDPIVPLPPLPGPTADPLPPRPIPPGPLAGTGADPLPPAPIVRTGPRFLTPPDEIRPPYPEVMRAREKEAVLRLKLSIDERGRVVAVDPVGKADSVFLAAARRHILKAWRYKPAMEGDRAIASSTVITLEFRLDS